VGVREGPWVECGLAEGPRVAWTRRGTWQLRMSERDLAIADVGEGPRVECGLGTEFEAFSLDLQWPNRYVKFIVRLRCF